MDNIFLDTSIFLKENFLEGKRMNLLLDMGKEKKVQIVLPLITINEVKSRFESSCKAAIELYGTIRNKWEISVLRNHDSLSEHFKKLPQLQVLAKDFNEKFDRKLSEANVLILPYPTLDTSETFRKYFANEAPFSNKVAKKHEFPDEFALMSLSQWCEGEKKKCLVFSMDNDFSGLKSRYLINVQNYEGKINELVSQFIEEERLKILDNLFVENEEFIKSELKQWVNDSLDDYSKYYEVSNSYEVYDVIIEKIETKIIGYQVIQVSESAIDVEVDTDISFHVDIVIDDENTMYKDYDDKTWHFADTTTVEVKRTENIPLKARFFITNKDEYLHEPDIYEFNNDIDLEIERDENF
ncbi:PIN domain-containing protein [Anaerocolumna jejuensis]|uniref:PIN domain-containing protein n=1 Tax=Anaerocolumna jejuensis TaxID=259063 RepID=UPI003F7B53F6